MPRQSRSNSRSGRFPAFHHDGHASVFTCPDCQGTLFLLKHGNLIKFQCRIGHSYSPESMLEAQNDNVERLMWSATRALEEQAEYVSQMANEIAKAEAPQNARQFVAKSRSALRKAQELRKLFTAES